MVNGLIRFNTNNKRHFLDSGMYLVIQLLWRLNFGTVWV